MTWLAAARGRKGLRGERVELGGMYPKLTCMISHVSPPPVLDAARDGEGGCLISAQISGLHSSSA